MDTARDLRSHVADCVRDALSREDNDSLGMIFRDGSYDDLHEIADQSVPVYNHEIVKVCLDAGLMNEEPEIGGATTPLQMMQCLLCEEATRIAYEVFDEFKDDEEDERERFSEFLERSRQGGIEFEDCEEAYDNFYSPRDTIESEVYEEVFEEFSQ